jgi:putative phosphoribosyl transferase
MIAEHLVRPAALFADRGDAGRAVAAELSSETDPELVVVGMARGGVVVAAEVARALTAPLDVVAVRKVRHPRRPEYGIGAVTAGDGVYIRSRDGLSHEQVAAAVEEARANALGLDARLHAEHDRLELVGKPVLVVDDGLATGGTMIATLRWARAAGARRVVAVLPVAAQPSMGAVRSEADEVVCPYELSDFFAVGLWYRSFDQIDDDEVVRLLAQNRRTRGAAAATP